MSEIPVVDEVSAEVSQRQEDISAFLTEYNMTVNRKKKRSLLEMNPSSFETFKLGIRVSHCCKVMDLDKAFKYYLEAKALDAKPLHSTFSNLLSLTAGLGEQGSGCGLIRTTDPPHDIDAAFVVYNDMKAADFPMHEAIYSALIRCCSMHDRATEALRLYRELQAQKVAPKLRTFTPLLTIFAQKLDDTTVYTIYDEMIGTVPIPKQQHTLTSATDSATAAFGAEETRYNITPTEREYAILLRLATAKRDSARFYAIFHALREDIPVPAGTEVWDAIRAWFTDVETSYTVVTADVAANGDISMVPGERLLNIDLEEERRLELMTQLDSFAVMRDDNKRFKPNNKIKDLLKNRANEQQAAAATVDTEAETSATAPSSAIQTAEVEVTERTEDSEVAAPTLDSEVMVTTTDPAAVTATAVESRKRSHPQAFDDEAQRLSRWAHYKEWLGSDNKQFDVIVDGANVGYYKQNYAGAPSHVDYDQIDQLLRHLQQLGHKPLLILHCRHLHKDMIPSDVIAAMTRRWAGAEESGLLMYSTPKGFNDDWFWIYAAVAGRCKVVTNDLMRDHHFQMLSPKWFCKWKERHQVHFEFGPWVKQAAVEEVVASTANEAGHQAVPRSAFVMTADVSGTAHIDAAGDVDSSGAVGHAPPLPSDSTQSSITWRHRCTRYVELMWPRLYSYCIQHIVSERYEGFYCPPPAAEEEDEDGGEEGEEVSGVSAVGAAYENDGDMGDEQFEEGQHQQWLCAFRKL